MRKTFKSFLFVAFTALLATAMMACRQQGSDNTAKTEQSTENNKTSETTQAAVDAEDDDDGWSFATVPLPQDSNPPRFVSNPDGVLSPDAEAELNRILLYARVELGVEGCIVAVNHVAYSDVEAFAYALFENFKPNDDMLVIVLAYQDKGVRVEIGHELEKRISEVECQKMLNQILIPSLREDDPDEGMLSFVEALYHKIEGN